MDLKLDDFQIGTYVKIQTLDKKEFSGILCAKNTIETQQRNVECVCIFFNGAITDIFLEDIEKYCCLDEADAKLGAKVYNEKLKDYDIQSGDTMASILRKFIDNWSEYDDETKSILISEVTYAVTTPTLKDLISAMASDKKSIQEKIDKYLKILNNDMVFMDKYEKFKKFLPDAMAKTYDALLFDVLKLKFAWEV